MPVIIIIIIYYYWHLWVYYNYYAYPISYQHSLTSLGRVIWPLSVSYGQNRAKNVNGIVDNDTNEGL